MCAPLEAFPHTARVPSRRRRGSDTALPGNLSVSSAHSSRLRRDSRILVRRVICVPSVTNHSSWMSGGSKVAPFTPPRSKHQFSRTAWSHTGSPRLAVPSLQGPPPGGEPGIERRAARAPKPRSACTRLPLSLVGSASVFRTGKDLYSCALAQNQEVAPVPVPVPGPVVAFVSGGQLSRLVLRNLAKMLRNLLALRQIAQRTISTASRRHFENKVPQKQKLFQENSEIPVHLKGGLADALLYRATMVLTVGGTAYAIYQLAMASFPKKPE
ncbi:Cytochrome c oxidase polypeptide 7A2, mitochondrial [Heterocephalus glaber]|uniref:Cytochrome c oxidase subunit 7A2, mitochondrial n=2 Tax=Heterocephalus glaber TaxID=10181 RepID=G5AMW5_HETGA|nr:Cytochrome c oxidase polypeptide 7A2, mitochondrial [Heterocephalus glaber]